MNMYMMMMMMMMMIITIIIIIIIIIIVIVNSIFVFVIRRQAEARQERGHPAGLPALPRADAARREGRRGPGSINRTNQHSNKHKHTKHTMTHQLLFNK